MIATHPSVEGSSKVARCGDSGVIDSFLLSPEVPAIVDEANKSKANEREQDNNMGVGIRFCLSSHTDARRVSPCDFMS